MTDHRPSPEHIRAQVCADLRAGVKIIWGKEMRGGLEGGHSHISWSSTPVLKRPGTWADCPACVEWVHEIDGSVESRQSLEAGGDATP